MKLNELTLVETIKQLKAKTISHKELYQDMDTVVKEKNPDGLADTSPAYAAVNCGRLKILPAEAASVAVAAWPDCDVRPAMAVGTTSPVFGKTARPYWLVGALGANHGKENSAIPSSAIPMKAFPEEGPAEFADPSMTLFLMQSLPIVAQKGL